jgi:hypothetical protein
MSETHSTVSSGTSVPITLEIVPVEEEEDDLDTLAAVGRVQADVQREIAHLDGYTVSTLPVSEHEQAARGIDIILLVTVIGASIAAYKDLLTSLFHTVSTVVEMLAKRGRVQEIEIIADGKTLILRDVSKKTARELIEAFEAQHPGSTGQLTPTTAVQVKAKVSKKSRTKK